MSDLLTNLNNISESNHGNINLASMIIMENRGLFTHTDISYAEWQIERLNFQLLKGTGKRIPHKKRDYKKYDDEMNAYLKENWNRQSLKHFSFLFKIPIPQICRHARTVLNLGPKISIFKCKE